MREPVGVALLTGAASGIGRQLVLDLSQRGWTVAGLDRNPSGLAELERTLAQQQQRRFAWQACDVTDMTPLQDAVKELAGRLGPADLLIACAGVAGWTPAIGMDSASIARIINVNLIGVSNTIAAVLPHMLARRRGHIVAISSLASLRGLPRQMGYCASKAGLNALMQSLALDVRPLGIDVTTVCPGHTCTPQATSMYNDGCLWPVEATAQQVLYAIDRKKRFHAFPWFKLQQLRYLRVLPNWLQGWLLHWNLAKTLK